MLCSGVRLKILNINSGVVLRHSSVREVAKLMFRMEKRRIMRFFSASILLYAVVSMYASIPI